ncbi:MAG TPA: heat-inducible transcriptional repressor HrcA [Solirubrobacteraceae bacterium]|jgi:heat-inducible transcriptional repressor|nr:heat-inducible transcriptional repressor HrcA [Solirubrobacteraceae bacterium]
MRILTPRQEQILRKVVEENLRTGQPVASRTIAADAALDCGPSTVRNELALLEEHGLLAHPHTSAGRVPTDAGHRYVVDRLLGVDGELAPTRPLALSLSRHEVEDAMRVTSVAISRVTRLLAVVSAPSLNTATIRHVDVLALQPELVMVVVITSTGGVSKTITTFDSAVDPGLLGWAGEYLRERLVGLGVGARMLSKRLEDLGLGASERAFVDRLAPAFASLAGESEDTLYFDGAARLLEDGRLHELSEINELMGLLERRAALLRVLRSAFGESGVYVRIGSENELPAMHSLALVAAGYGIARRPLGAVSVIGPVHMDYAGAIATVREAAHELSRFVEDAYASSR